MIEIKELKKQFGQTTACDISAFTINDGDILGLVGNNGAGKTTLFRLMLDLLKADEGSLTLNGCIPSESEQWKNYTSAYLDDSFLIDYLTPSEYFSFLGKISSISQEEIDQQLHAYEYFAGEEIINSKKLIRNLSAGNKQKVGIISAFFRNPSIMILDEPFNFLDPTSQNNLKRLILEYHEITHATILISSHNLQYTTDISTRIALMEKGQIINDIKNENNAAEKELKAYFEHAQSE